MQRGSAIQDNLLLREFEELKVRMQIAWSVLAMLAARFRG